ncbi:hypothetical protein LCGC14_1272910 [marine sediment metagenome]|uniref:DNA alkylation repair enzyme n=1 Tax=marine sediment metagenome TaxID=412755 RepID=A0A0F9P0J3_9ZZZZ
MSEQLKYKLDITAVESIATECLNAYSVFDHAGFMAVVDTHLDSLELKARATFIAECLFTFLPTDYVSSLPIIVEVARRLPSEPKAWADYRLWPLLDFIALYGLREVSLSLDALEKLTPKFTAEFAIRAFLHEDFEQTYQRMLNWSEHQNEHVRRLASEGMRPRLPWATQLRSLRTDPTPIWPVLEQLKNDPSLYVRRSVANNLNDISKDHPHQVLRCCRQWYGKTAECDWIVRHGLRSLVKTGEPSVYPLLGYTENPTLANCQLSLSASQISIGETLTLSFFHSA